MLKSCPFCGIVPMDHKCPHRKYKEPERELRPFRSSSDWTKKSKEIRQRDRNLCKACEAELKGTNYKYNYNGLEVHHIIPLCEDYNKRLDNDNLITLCKLHHEMAECGQISRETLKALISPVG